MGGMEPGAVYVLAGRPGSGKTSLGVQWAVAIAQDIRDGRMRVSEGFPDPSGGVVLMFSLEMNAAQLGRRVVSGAAGVAADVLRYGRHEGSRRQAASRPSSGCTALRC